MQQDCQMSLQHLSADTPGCRFLDGQPLYLTPNPNP